ncbi:GNAT family N-acetyltransferase [Sphingomonas soli]|uniref:GNAT family N-acetyltransferase n=1 Tax=Sphingomonas soli TaxID=266127 RepID=UPI0008300CA1|nr:GNAT family N-acetyltransferase [Sphingomonas soli]
MSGVTDNKDRSRYELAVDGHTAFAAYTIDGARITFTHTIVPAALQGQGIAGRLIGAALADVRARGMKLVPQCEFVAAYLAKHPEERDLIA